MNQNRNVITYSETDAFWNTFPSFIQRVIEQNRFKLICDIGGGANPLLPAGYISENNLDYTLLDISENELSKAPDHYSKIVRDITTENIDIHDQYDLAFTRMLAEHVRDGCRLHKNIYTLLKPGGMAVHFFPTLYALPFIANRLLPEKAADYLLNIFAPRQNRYQHEKFPAWYSWCRGPTGGMMANLNKTGYEIVEYKGLFGHGYYNKIPFIHNLQQQLARFLLKHPSPYLTSYACLVLQKPRNRI